jgi:hypothetical protein
MTELTPPPEDPRSRFRPAPIYPKAEAEQVIVVMRHELRYIADDLDNMGDEPVSASNTVSFFVGLAVTLLVTVLAGLTDSARDWVGPVFLAVALMALVAAGAVWHFSKGPRKRRRTERLRIVKRLRDLDARYPD